MSRHRAPVRPRYGRLAVLGASVTVTVVAVVGAVAGFPGTSGGPAAARIDPAASSSTAAPTPTPTPTPSASTSVSPRVSESADDPAEDTALPAGSGTGKRIVFSQSRQRVWLVDDGTDVRRTYLVSGSKLDNLDPGTYAVYSKSRWAVGIDDSGVMQYFVRFTQGPSGAAIGFHTIPTKDGSPLQTKQQLGTPQSHGCIRQRTPDAIALWDFAPIGAKVVVTA
ncbi:L,D-transpeptidase [Nocardioides mangrovi]|uniref:L,D-transpeptidase n=1 Tax=Nocardioides mangrovi TaxID=2874580 RepID=A0ABS7U8S6_9ACTN|nr:L,D-transpeptidase [Nocardioides mangrovi]MBZ5737280.1 L,D-transpeptidase [Nocardioides mangrovi]